MIADPLCESASFTCQRQRAVQVTAADIAAYDCRPGIWLSRHQSSQCHAPSRPLQRSTVPPRRDRKDYAAAPLAPVNNAWITAFAGDRQAPWSSLVQDE